MTKVLVAYGSKRGGTEEIAERIGAALREDGLEAVVLAARDVTDVRAYDAVILGGSLFLNRWHRDAHSFARRHQRILRQRPVWLFSSGILDLVVEQGVLDRPGGMTNAFQALDARGQATFGGPAPGGKGILGSVLGKKTSGAYQDPERIRAWTSEIAAQLTENGGVVRPLNGHRRRRPRHAG